ncbi:hypothetical protein A5855_000510, partial [Enterococcus faecium]
DRRFAFRNGLCWGSESTAIT